MKAMEVNHDSAIPLYKQIEQIIRNLIDSGKYDKGNFLPREVELARKLGVSRNTVRQGIAQLVREGLLERTPGKGTVVADKNITTHLAEWHSFSEEMQQKGIRLKNYFIRSEFVTPPLEAAKALQVDDDSSVLKLERLRGHEECPFVYFVSWFHPRTKLNGDEDFAQPLYSILEDKYSVYPVYSNENLSAILPNEQIAGYLQIKQSTPVLYRKRLVLDANEQPIEYNIGFYRSDELSYSIRFKRSIK